MTTHRQRMAVPIVGAAFLLLLATDVLSFSATLAPVRTKQDIQQAQQAALDHVLQNPDPFTANALAVSVPERSTPTPCTGQVPSDLPRGCLLRIGPSGAANEDGFLDGDGMVHCITFPPVEGNQPSMYSATYVDTAGRQNERKAREQGRNVVYKGTLGACPNGFPMLGNLMENVINFQTPYPSKDTFNTALACSGNRVLALQEQCPPSEISISKTGVVTTKENMSRLGGAIPSEPVSGGSFSAHGRTCSKTGDRIHVSYSAHQPIARIDTFGDNWKLKSSVPIKLDVPIMLHDTAITDSYTILLGFPLSVRPRRFLSNSFPVAYEPELGAKIGLVRRQPAGDSQNDESVQWFDVEQGVVLHAINAYERPDGKVVIHAPRALPATPSSYMQKFTPSFLHEWVLDPASGKTVSERCLNPEIMMEFPQVDPRQVAKEADACFAIAVTGVSPLYEFVNPQDLVTLDRLVKVSLVEDKEVKAGDLQDEYVHQDGWHFISEPTVVPKTSGDGNYVLLIATKVPKSKELSRMGYKAVAQDGKSLSSKVMIFDGDNLSSGPVSEVHLPYHVGYGLHSMFLEWDKMT